MTREDLGFRFGRNCKSQKTSQNIGRQHHVRPSGEGGNCIPPLMRWLSNSWWPRRGEVTNLANGKEPRRIYRHEGKEKCLEFRGIRGQFV